MAKLVQSRRSEPAPPPVGEEGLLVVDEESGTIRTAAGTAFAIRVDRDDEGLERLMVVETGGGHRHYVSAPLSGPKVEVARGRSDDVLTSYTREAIRFVAGVTALDLAESAGANRLDDVALDLALSTAEMELQQIEETLDDDLEEVSLSHLRQLEQRELAVRRLIDRIHTEQSRRDGHG
ncbi:MAG: hypothetical protein EAZ99_05850 [Alphaproteobacteria bacterium]|nr:hypothetical protein [Alphaproteobacteria bacterium]TAD90566.1 MAG: hypothetical protein EAZ99_05850 [Alphaproteobacteria bacterium]